MLTGLGLCLAIAWAVRVGVGIPHLLDRAQREVPEFLDSGEGPIEGAKDGNGPRFDDPLPSRQVSEEVVGPVPPEIGREPLGASASDREASYTNLPAHRASEQYDPGDLDVLRDLIELNGVTERSSAHDYDDGDGVLEPLEFGYQVWRSGRLVELHAGPNAYFSFGYDLEQLPDSIGKLDRLAELDLHSNRLSQLPGSIRFLKELEVLRLYRNRLTELPEQIWGLSALRKLVLSENDLTQLPDAIEDLSSLEVLHLRDNPLLQLPETIGELQNLQILTVNRTDGGDGIDGTRLSELPASMDELRILMVLHVGGNSLNCERAGVELAGVPEFLVNGSVEHVYGLNHQLCLTGVLQQSAAVE